MVDVEATRATMRAIVCRKPAGPADLHVEEVPRPAAADDALLVKVHSSSANPVDLFQLSAVAHLMRRFQPAGVGTDFAGVVEEVGPKVTKFKVGDEVFGAAHGAFAEYLTVAENAGVVLKPAGASFADTGTLAVAACTALQAVRDHGRIKPGKRVLINGASGGVGTFAVQVAKALGGEVTAVCSTRNVELVRSIGADAVVDYTREDFARRDERYDLIIDVAGSHALSQCLRLLDHGGAFVSVGAAAIQHGRGGSYRALAHLARVRLASSSRGDRSIAIFIARVRKEDLTLLGGLVARGRIRPVIEHTYNLAEAGEALARIDEGHLQGKLAIAIA